MVVYTRLKYERTGINTQPAVEEVCQNVNLYLVLGTWYLGTGTGTTSS